MQQGASGEGRAALSVERGWQSWRGDLGELPRQASSHGETAGSQECLSTEITDLEHALVEEGSDIQCGLVREPSKSNGWLPSSRKAARNPLTGFQLRIESNFSSDWLKSVMCQAGMELRNGVKELRNFQRSLQINDTLYTAVSVKPACLDVALILTLSVVENLKETFTITFFPKILCSL